jgi:hypothetical protein
MCIVPIKELRSKQVNRLVQDYSQGLSWILWHGPVDLLIAIPTYWSAVENSGLHFIHFKLMGAT